MRFVRKSWREGEPRILTKSGLGSEARPRQRLVAGVDRFHYDAEGAGV